MCIFKVRNVSQWPNLRQQILQRILISKTAIEHKYRYTLLSNAKPRYAFGNFDKNLEGSMPMLIVIISVITAVTYVFVTAC